jgi:molybdenum cofactor biosynthesis enzyme MoaA
MIQGKTFQDKYYCSSPFNSLFIDIHGGVSSCCASTYSFGNHLNDEDTDIKNILHNSTAEELRKKISSGIVDSYCNNCVSEEKYFGNSQRTHFDNIKINTKKFELRTLDLRWSNLCNFSCIYCDERFSSSWAKKKGLGLAKENVTSQSSIFNLIEENVDTIEKIMLAGGEPLLQMQNDKLLSIVKKDTSITIITNLGIELEKSNIFKKLQDFDNILWAVSMENIEEQFEYVRQGGNWDRMVYNLNLIKNGNPKHKMNFLSVMNILSLSQLHEFIRFSNDIEIPIMWQYIQGNDDVLHPENFSESVKSFLIEKIKKIPQQKNNIDYNQSNLNQISYKLQNNINTEFVDLKFRNYIKNQDSKYNETSKNFSDLWPELDKIILR